MFSKATGVFTRGAVIAVGTSLGGPATGGPDAAACSEVFVHSRTSCRRQRARFHVETVTDRYLRQPIRQTVIDKKTYTGPLHLIGISFRCSVVDRPGPFGRTVFIWCRHYVYETFERP